jgi:hypothetical protein
VLTERRPRPALEMLAARSSVPVVLDRRLPSAHEAALYFVAAEALTNVTKYAIASAFEVALQRADPWAEIAVTDDGVGGARTDAGGRSAWPVRSSRGTRRSSDACEPTGRGDDRSRADPSRDSRPA